MSPVNLTSAVVVGMLYTAGTYLLLQRSLMRVLIGLVLLGHGTTLLLLLVGGESGKPPMVGSTAPESMSDPLPQGMALTSVVITFALTTFLLALAYRAWTLLGDDEVRDDIEDARIARMDRALVGAHAGTPRAPARPAAARPGDQHTHGGVSSHDTYDTHDTYDRYDGHDDGGGVDQREPGELAVPGLLERHDAHGWSP